jgi:thioredoxin-like negative regulator of GroEL
MVHELSKQYENVAFGLIDIDFNEESSGKLQIRSVPTFIFQFNGEEIDRFAGADKERLLKNVVELSHKN